VEPSLFTELLSDTLQSEGSISIDTALRDIPEWDSMSAVVVLTMAERHFNKKVSLADLKSLTTASDLYALLTG